MSVCLALIRNIVWNANRMFEKDKKNGHVNVTEIKEKDIGKG